MNKEEFRAALDELSLSQMEVARLLKISDRAARRYASGEAEIPGPVEMHLRLWLEIPEMIDVVRRLGAEADRPKKGK
jgi:predicted transcriptional regulator